MAKVSLPPLPSIRLVLVDVEVDPAPPGAYLKTRRLRLQAQFADHETSEVFRYDVADRAALDAVVIVPHFRDASGRRHIVLRSALRPPVAFRPREVWPVPERPTLGGLWEVPAGLVEPNERSPEGLKSCASRELYEEVGASAPPEAMQPLGPSTFPCPGVIGERHFFFHVEVDPRALVPPPEDGSVLERDAKLAFVALDDALELVRAGEIEDAKTEIALRRLAEEP